MIFGRLVQFRRWKWTCMFVQIMWRVNSSFVYMACVGYYYTLLMWKICSTFKKIDTVNMDHLVSLYMSFLFNSKSLLQQNIHQCTLLWMPQACVSEYANVLTTLSTFWVCVELSVEVSSTPEWRLLESSQKPLWNLTLPQTWYWLVLIRFETWKFQFDVVYVNEMRKETHILHNEPQNSHLYVAL